MEGNDRKMPETGPCFVCGKTCGRGSYCVPCEGFACWTHRNPSPMTETSKIPDHARCDHG